MRTSIKQAPAHWRNMRQMGASRRQAALYISEHYITGRRYSRPVRTTH